jgi:hypothetical protein
MSLSVTPSSQNLSMRDLMKEKRDAMKQMETDVSTGNLSAAQNDLQQVKSIGQEINGGNQQDGVSAVQGAQNTTSTTAANIINDLKDFVQSIVSGSDQNTQAAQQQLQNDFANLLSSNTGADAQPNSITTQSQNTNPLTQNTQGTQGTQKTHHHHHHIDSDGDDMSGGSAVSSSPTITGAQPASTDTSTQNLINSSQNTNPYSAFDTNPITSYDGARQVAMNAYSMLMAYTNTSTGITSGNSSESLNMLL